MKKITGKHMKSTANVFITTMVLAAGIALGEAQTVTAETTADVIGIEAYGGDLSAKTYQNVEFSVENLGVSSMALGSIINPSSNIVTAQRILEKKQFYDNGTDGSWMNQDQSRAVEDFLNQWKAANISSGMSEEDLFRTIYDYMTSTITYEKEAPNGQSSYGALIDKRCVCGGFTNGFLKMAKACGLDAKYLILSDHAFNLVNVSGKWYATDTTQKVYNSRSTVGVYYLHTTPELDDAIEEKVKAINERNQNKGQTIDDENVKYQGFIQEAWNENAIFHVNDENLVSGLLDYVMGKVDANQYRQRIFMILYTDGNDFTNFHKMQFSYNGMEDRIHKVVAAELKGRNTGRKAIKQTSSCNIRYRKELGEDGMDTFARLWTDEAGQTFVLLDCQLYFE
ncbi:MAG: hypothetical protein LIP16_06195 [Clostridium sp.]|nr:hypothetical protein [Clostridium sp.]